MNKLTQEQITEIKERTTKAQAYLKELDLVPSAVVQKENIGEGIFVDKVIAYLQDTKYSKKDEPAKEIEKPVEVK
jgi:hypothetical protein